MSTVPPLLAGLLPPLPLELLLQAAAPRATTAAMAAIAVVRLILPFLSLIGPGRAGDPPDTDRRSKIRDKGLVPGPRPKPQPVPRRPDGGCPARLTVGTPAI